MLSPNQLNIVLNTPKQYSQKQVRLEGPKIQLPDCCVFQGTGIRLADDVVLQGPGIVFFISISSTLLIHMALSYKWYCMLHFLGCRTQYLVKFTCAWAPVLGAKHVTFCKAVESFHTSAADL